jgi:glucose-6-phosphate dehydrogenase assembly protein OpcA
MQSSSIQVIDMNWARMAGWRNIFEQTFDSKEHIDQLRACHQMKVIYNVPKNESLHHPDIQALYFQAWIATQLEWTYERTERKKNNVIFYYQTPRNAFQVILQSQSHEDLPTKEILGLELEGPNDYLCTLERQKEGQVFVNCSDQYQCELPFTLILPTLHKSHYFMQQVVFQKPSKQYKNMLHMILKMQEAT